MSEIARNQEIPFFEWLPPETKGFKEIKPKDGTTFQDSQKFWDSYFNSQINEKEHDCLSTYDERLRQTPREDANRGHWDGARGESNFVLTDPEIQKHSKIGRIPYKNAIPDFSKESKAIVEINMTENRAKNFKQADEKCAEQWNKETHDGKNDWTPRDVALWRKGNEHLWHERNDRKTCDLIPKQVHDSCGHLGGVSECKKRDASNNGGNFDE